MVGEASKSKAISHIVVGVGRVLGTRGSEGDMTHSAGLADRDWVDHAACAGGEPDALFVQGAAQREARVQCLNCPVRLQCLADALQHESNFGVWGGLTERERRAMLRHYPEVEDWHQWLLESDDALAEELRKPLIPRVLARVRTVA